MQETYFLMSSCVRDQKYHARIRLENQQRVLSRHGGFRASGGGEETLLTSDEIIGLPQFLTSVARVSLRVVGISDIPQAVGILHQLEVDGYPKRVTMRFINVC